jgi:AbrB family looped-hinge helix DNA binding protein
MTISTITDKGQTTVPVKIRRALKLRPRQRIEWVTKRDGTVVIRPVRSAGEFAGCLRSDVSFPGIKEEKDAAAQAWVVDEKVKE